MPTTCIRVPCLGTVSGKQPNVQYKNVIRDPSWRWEIPAIPTFLQSHSRFLVFLGSFDERINKPRNILFFFIIIIIVIILWIFTPPLVELQPLKNTVQARLKYVDNDDDDALNQFNYASNDFVWMFLKNFIQFHAMLMHWKFAKFGKQNKEQIS